MKKFEFDDALKINRYFIERDKELSLEETGNEISVSLNDLFISGCYLHLIGKTTAGKAAVESALKSGLVHKKNWSFYDRIIRNLSGNELTLTAKCRCHGEFHRLFQPYRT